MSNVHSCTLNSALIRSHLTHLYSFRSSAQTPCRVCTTYRQIYHLLPTTIPLAPPLQKLLKRRIPPYPPPLIIPHNHIPHQLYPPPARSTHPSRIPTHDRSNLQLRTALCDLASRQSELIQTHAQPIWEKGKPTGRISYSGSAPYVLLCLLSLIVDVSARLRLNFRSERMVLERWGGLGMKKGS